MSLWRRVSGWLADDEPTSEATAAPDVERPATKPTDDAPRVVTTPVGHSGRLRPTRLPIEDEQVEAAMRWRLILGNFSDEQLGFDQFDDLTGDDGLAALVNEARHLDVPLGYIYDREYTQRSHRQRSTGPSHGLTIPAWLNRVRVLFPQEARRVIERDALVRYGLTELITDPEILRKAAPNTDLLKAILQFKHMMKGEVLEAAREQVRAVVDALSHDMENACRSALHGATESESRPPVRTFRNADWKKTIRRNLKNWDADRDRLIADQIYYRHRQRNRSDWRVIVAVDQSGSMTDSLIYSAVMAAIFSSLPSVEVHLVLWDTRVVDVTQHVDDPLEVLMGSQLGGGTELLPALSYCAGLITEPAQTLFVLISDWYIWNDREKCLAMAHELTEAGVRGIGLSALDADCRPIYDERFAKQLAGCGWFVGAMTPKQLAEHVAKVFA